MTLKERADKTRLINSCLNRYDAIKNKAIKYAIDNLQAIADKGAYSYKGTLLDFVSSETIEYILKDPKIWDLFVKDLYDVDKSINNIQLSKFGFGCNNGKAMEYDYIVTVDWS